MLWLIRTIIHAYTTPTRPTKPGINQALKYQARLCKHG